MNSKRLVGRVLYSVFAGMLLDNPWYIVPILTLLIPSELLGVLATGIVESDIRGWLWEKHIICWGMFRKDEETGENVIWFYVPKRKARWAYVVLSWYKLRIFAPEWVMKPSPKRKKAKKYMTKRGLWRL